ncbi:putative uncharacterized protein DDB_G0288137 [Engraulis encrasicolus]|uniref:putative uncharacterized protein DDB_G0288137 n=1 Tax=Engraulis encrasicolus TaxID=184585 RepID=UPI002FD79781
MDLNCGLKEEEFEENIFLRQEIKRETDRHDIKQEDSTAAEISTSLEEEEEQEQQQEQEDHREIWISEDSEEESHRHIPTRTSTF